jgi:hypothetical protein
MSARHAQVAIFRVNSSLTTALDMFLSIRQKTQPLAGRMRLSTARIRNMGNCTGAWLSPPESSIRGSLALTSTPGPGRQLFRYSVRCCEDMILQKKVQLR